MLTDTPKQAAEVDTAKQVAEVDVVVVHSQNSQGVIITADKIYNIFIALRNVEPDKVYKDLLENLSTTCLYPAEIKGEHLIDKINDLKRQLKTLVTGGYVGRSLAALIPSCGVATNGWRFVAPIVIMAAAEVELNNGDEATATYPMILKLFHWVISYESDDYETSSNQPISFFNDIHSMIGSGGQQAYIEKRKTMRVDDLNSSPPKACK